MKNMKKKIIVTFISCLLAAAVLAGCNSAPASEPASAPAPAPGGDAAGEPAPAAGPYTFGYSATDGQNPFFIAVEKTMRDLVEGNGDALLSTDPANDNATQLSDIEELLAIGLDGMFLNPVDSEGVLPGLEQLKAANVPVVNFDSPLGDMSYAAAYVGADGHAAGVACGEDLAKRLPGGGPVLILNSPAMQSMTERANGFKDAIEGKGFEVVGEGDARGNKQIGEEVCAGLLGANPGVVAVFAGNDPAALGALAAVKAAGLDNVLVYGVDGSPAARAEMAAEGSLMAGSAAQNPVAIATSSVEVMYKLMNGERINERYIIETFLITPENVADYGTEEWP